MEVYLVRHGEAAAQWGQSADPGLSELGRQQAASAACELQSCLAPDVQLCSSPLARAQETAAPLAAALNKPLRIDPAYREIPAPVPLAQRKAWLRQAMTETWSEQSGELLSWRQELLQAVVALSSPTVIYTHFLVINAVVGSLQQRDDILCFWPDNASVTRLELAQGELALVQLGRELDTVVN